MSNPSFPDDKISVVEGKMVWDSGNFGLVLIAEDKYLHCGSLVPAALEGKRVRVIIEVLDEQEADTDPAPAPSSR